MSVTGVISCHDTVFFETAWHGLITLTHLVISDVSFQTLLRAIPAHPAYFFMNKSLRLLPLSVSKAVERERERRARLFSHVIQSVRECLYSLDQIFVIFRGGVPELR